MHVLYPQNPLDASQADEPYHAEFQAVAAAGIDCSLFDFDALEFGQFQPKPTINRHAPILYRGWMMSPSRYRKLVESICQRGGEPVTNGTQFVTCHHLPNWYEQCKAFTPETRFFAYDDQLEANVAKLGWEQFFVKDFVKSNTADLGSIANSPKEVSAIVEQLAFYRGDIEGGIAIRRVEPFRRETEQRLFVVNGVPLSVDGDPPDLADVVAARIDAPFFSMDIVENEDGEIRVVELGDGQVSDKKSWPIEAFVEVIAALA
ncbi:MAG: ATP-grasp domain-containing protein [Pseudomonadota bacterium]